LIKYGEIIIKMDIPNVMSMIPGFWGIMFIVLTLVAIAVGGPYIIAWLMEQMIK